MTSILIFSKDRPLQLHSTIDSILRFASGYNSVSVLFRASNSEFLESYNKLNKLPKFATVDFIDESHYGFQNTLVSLLDSIEEDSIVMETDDTIYCDFIDFSKYKNYLSQDCGRVNFTADSMIYSRKFLQEDGVCWRFERVPDTNSNEQLCLNYPFNVSSTIHKTKDVLELITSNVINNPFELEWTGSSSPIFTKYKYNYLVRSNGPIVRQLHINNFLDRYEEYYSLLDMQKKFVNGFVFDLDFSILKYSYQNLEWFSNKNIDNKFPVFPWDVDPKDYEKVLRYKVLE